MIELRDLAYRYPHRESPALDGFSLALAEGERLGLSGPTGAGKSTLLHAIVGLVKPQSGETIIFGRPRRREADFTEVRARIGLLFQDPDDQLFCPTVEEDVAFGPLNLGRTRADARAIVNETLERLAISHLAGRLTHTLSGGEKRLASLAAVLAMRPQALLLDEPTSGLDEETTSRVADFLLQSGLTALVVSHDREFLSRVATRTARMERGGAIAQA